MLSDSMKLCSTCKAHLPLSSFSKCNKNKDRLQYNCKLCQRKWRKEYYRKNKEKIYQNTMRWRRKNREKTNKRTREWLLGRRKKVLDILGGQVCVMCGCDDIRVLQIHHVNGDGSKEYKEKGQYQIYSSILKGERSVEDLEVRCRLCNIHEYIQRAYGIDFSIKWLG